jgi:hypothetical protein
MSDPQEDPEVTQILPYSISVQSGPDTRAQLQGTSLTNGQYVFSANDKLYIKNGDGTVSGVLNLLSGVGTSAATFNGTLSCTGSEPDAETMLHATLVGASQESFLLQNGQPVDTPNYPDNISYSTVQSLVQNYSHFTADFSFATHSITLTQQSVFVDFSYSTLKEYLIGTPSSVQVDIKSSDGNTTIQSISGIPVTGTSAVAKISFTSVFPAGTSLQGAQIWMNNGSGVHCLPDFANDLVLEANKYYRAARYGIDDFTIEAPLGGGGANITFNWPANVQYNIYNGSTWEGWKDIAGSIVLTAGYKVSFRGSNTTYTNSGSKPLFTTDNSVRIYGDIMSLVLDGNGDRKDKVEANAFKQAFFYSTDAQQRKIDIHPDKDLVLSADTLSANCYEGMFKNSKQLTKSPVLPATKSAASCYLSMFEGCTALDTPPSSIPLSTIANAACKKMFSGCTSLVNAPIELSFTTVEESGCAEMFYGCSALVTPPSSLPGETLGLMAYNMMFYNCTALKSIPDFPHDPSKTYSFADATVVDVTGSNTGVCNQMFFNCTSLTSLAGKQLFNSTSQLGKGCFQDMFSTCTKLDTIPNTLLPATKLAESCYRGMFQSTAITNAPDLLAENLKANCYRYMFNKCTKLKYIKCYSGIKGSTTYTQNWLKDSNNQGAVFHHRAGVTWDRNEHGIPNKWTPVADTVQ